MTFIALIAATAYVNGFWWTGGAFVAKTAYVDGEALSFRKPAQVDETIDLRGGYVVPPFGEAHNHNVEPLNDVPKLIATYLAHGIFSVKNPNSLPRDRATVAPLVNRADSIDVTFANGGWTSSGGHPAEIAKRLIDGHRWTEADGEGGFYRVADTAADVERKWPAYLAQKPDFVKVYLLYSDQRRDPQKYFGWKGLGIEALREIVKRAHRAKLRVSAHVESARDFHEALLAGVDEINHMPGFRIQGDVDVHAAREFEIDDADAGLARRHDVTVVTTLVGATRLAGDERKEQDALNARNLRRLLAHRVPVVLGSDSYREDTLAEALYIASLRAVSNAELLRMWIVGRLDEGSKASFLVLAGDPLADFTNATRIVRRVKQGKALP